MSRIDLRGVIVPSEYDASWAAGYIDKGIIIPESRFRSALAGANKGEPLTVYVNSPGGSVFSANEMVNAVREWKAETKQAVNVVLGALTASAASAFAIMVADTIKAHANAKMMFHGAWVMTVGGKEMHQDTAELLDQINGDIKARLVGKYGMSPEKVTEWFAEGREGWLSAKELVESKLASEIIADPSDVIDFPADALGDIEKRGLGIAAVLKNLEVKADVSGQGGGVVEDGNGVTGGAAPKSIDPVGSIPEPINESGVQYQAGVVAGKAAKCDELTARINQLDEQCRSLQGAKDKARAEVEKLTVEMASMKAAHEKAMIDVSAANDAAKKKIDSEHSAIVADLSGKLATATAKCEKLVSGGVAFSPAKADKAGRTASDVDPCNRLHPSLR